jgi:peptidyl-prolyl cis-trans isomerase SurA
MRVVFSILAAVIAAGSGLQVQAQLANGIKAVVHDSVITFQDVDVLTMPAADVLHRMYPGQPEAFQKKLAEALNENLEELIERQLILHEFKTAGYNLPETFIDEAIQEEIHSRFGDRATLTRTLKAQGMTLEKYRQQLRERIIVQALRSKNISSEIIISPHKIERFYAENHGQFKVEDEVKLRMIVLNHSGDSSTAQTRAMAEEILSRINDGASFAEMAAVYSQGSQRRDGGDWGWVEKSVLRKELADVAFNLQAGERSGVIETPEACYLMQVDERRPTRIKPLSDVREEIEKTLVTQERARLQKQWIERLKKKTFVRYF